VEDPPANVLEHREYTERAYRDDHQHRQSLEAAAIQHTVVHLKHEQRHSEMQDRDEEADEQREQKTPDELPPDEGQRFVCSGHAGLTPTR
jgi:hypothetical protein